MIMKHFALSLTLLGAIIAFPTQSQAQDSDPANKAEEQDVIIVTGQKQTDPAMSAFLAGDFETAEIEFDRNAFCALRVARNFRAGLDSARDDSIQVEVAGNGNIANQPTGGQGGVVTPPSATAAAPVSAFNSRDFQKSKSNTKRTCENRGFQIYMKGLSQLELGKIEDAKKTLYQATKVHRTLYDAHFKLSLLEYQAGDLDKAKKELKRLRKISTKCRRCEAKSEIESQIKYLDTLLNQ